MLGLTVYADESGTHDLRGASRGSEVTAIAGYAATRQNWERFSRRWKTALRQYGVEVFHMSSYWRKDPPYDKWSDAKQKKFLAKLIKIARDNTWFAIGGMVPTKDWHEAVPDDIKAGGIGGRLDFSHPYHFCFQMFFARLMDVLTEEVDRILKAKRSPFAKNFHKEKVTFIFDRQDQFQQVASVGFDIIKEVVDPNDRLASLTFGSKEQYIPLQAADLIAFYARRILTHQMQGKPWRDPFERLLEERHNLMLYYFTRGQLYDFARKAIAAKKQRTDAP
jgi:hypothetical protein